MKANIIVVLDPHGRGRAVLRTREDDFVVIQLGNATGRMRAGLGIGPDGGPSLVLVDGSGRPRLSVT